MNDFPLYAFVEDEPSREIAIKLVETWNANRLTKISFADGFPSIMGGYGAIKIKCPKFVNMAKARIPVLIITDLDKSDCPVNLIRDWFSLAPRIPINLPSNLIFRVAVREVESWILADRLAFGRFIGISAINFASKPDTLTDPKQHLLSIISKKGKKGFHKEMIPSGTASIGPRYNEVLCKFIRQHWSPTRALSSSPSLARAINAVKKM